MAIKNDLTGEAFLLTWTCWFTWFTTYNIIWNTVLVTFWMIHLKTGNWKDLHHNKDHLLSIPATPLRPAMIAVHARRHLSRHSKLSYRSPCFDVAKIKPRHLAIWLVALVSQWSSQLPMVANHLDRPLWVPDVASPNEQSDPGWIRQIHPWSGQ